jgi:hypothetical protein
MGNPVGLADFSVQLKPLQPGRSNCSERGSRKGGPIAFGNLAGNGIK